MPTDTSSPPAYPSSGVTTPTRYRERMTHERAAVHAVLDEGVSAHVGFVVDGAPVVLPHLYARVGDELFLHGSVGARALRMAGDGGLLVCVTVTLTDGLVLARSAFHHSINYRCAVIHGTAVPVTDDDAKRTALAALVDAVVPGRSAEVRGPNRKELVATTVLRLPLHDVSLKVRTGPSGDDEADVDLPYWAGVLPLRDHVPGVAVPASDLPAGIVLPDHVSRWRRPQEGGSPRSASSG
ncbi:MAG: pyridoxamine 5'-phosphate oxidase family protein [Propionibacteriaceae bacterium]